MAADLVPSAERIKNLDRFFNRASFSRTALLVPAEPLKLAIASQRRGKNSLDFDDLFKVARQFDVSVHALVWQMVNNRIIEKPKAMALLEKIEGRVSLWEKRKDETPPPARPIRYEALAREAIEKGMVGTGVFAKCELFLRSGQWGSGVFGISKQPTEARLQIVVWRCDCL